MLLSNPMVIISRGQAIYIFYCEPYNEGNVTKFSKIIDDLKNVEICYGENPKRPFLCSKKSMQLNPSEYKQYPAIFRNKILKLTVVSIALNIEVNKKSNK